MTRSDLVEELAARFSQLTHRDAEYAVKTILDAMSEALVRGHRIEIRGFGSFSINRRPPAWAAIPRSGESVHIPEKRVPHFKPGKALREAVDQRTPKLENAPALRSTVESASPGALMKYLHGCSRQPFFLPCSPSR
jgi:integration host factor subunit beta